MNLAAIDAAQGRVITLSHEILTVSTAGGEVQAEISGRLRYAEELWPVVGDYVVVRGGTVVDEVLPRRNAIVRKDPGAANQSQTLAANVDVMFIVTAFDSDLNIRRLERYLVLAAESRVRPVIVINKIDLAEDAGSAMNSVRAIAGETHVIALSAVHDADSVVAHVSTGETAVLVGSSGVGKSTIVNALLRQSLQETGNVRMSDHRGRHTTTQRCLIEMPGGWFLIDTPGLREIQPWTGAATVTSTFEDVEELAAQCRFRDCTHSGEPGCAVQAAIDGGELDPSRKESLLKLRKEAQFLERQVDARANQEYQRKMKALMRSVKKHPKYNR